MRFQFEPIRIGDGCVLGERSSVMGHSVMEAASMLMPMAQGLKGTVFSGGKAYGGNPADCVRAQGAGSGHTSPRGCAHKDVNQRLRRPQVPGVGLSKDAEPL